MDSYRKLIRKSFPATCFSRFQITSMPVIALYFLTAAVALEPPATGGPGNSTTNATAAAAVFARPISFFSPDTAAPWVADACTCGVGAMPFAERAAEPCACLDTLYAPQARLFLSESASPPLRAPDCGAPESKPTRTQAMRDLLALISLTLAFSRALREFPNYITVLSNMAGYTHRVTRLIDVLREWDAVYHEFETSRVRVPVDADLRAEGLFLDGGGGNGEGHGPSELGAAPPQVPAFASQVADRWWEGVTPPEKWDAPFATTRRVVEASFIGLVHVRCTVPQGADEVVAEGGEDGSGESDIESEAGHGRRASTPETRLSIAESLMRGGAVLLRDVSLRVRAGESVIITVSRPPRREPFMTPWLSATLDSRHRDAPGRRSVPAQITYLPSSLSPFGVCRARPARGSPPCFASSEASGRSLRAQCFDRAPSAAMACSSCPSAPTSHTARCASKPFTRTRPEIKR